MRALVTGGNGGMANAITKALAQTGWRVFSPSREIMDVTSSASIETYVQAVKPNLLVNVAGYINPMPWVSLSSYREFEKHLAVNLTGAVKCAMEVLLYNDMAGIINISSASGLGGRGDGWGPYSIAKSGLITFSESLANDGYMAWTISPHRTATKMRKHLFPDEDPTGLMPPTRIGEIVLEVVKGEYPIGSNIEVSKNEVVVHDNRYKPRG